MFFFGVATVGVSSLSRLLNGSGQIYRLIAVRLTESENHERQSEFENSLILKLFVFQFINAFFSLYYQIVLYVNGTLVDNYGVPLTSDFNAFLFRSVAALLVIRVAVSLVTQLVLPYDFLPMLKFNRYSQLTVYVCLSVYVCVCGVEKIGLCCSALI